MLRQSVSENPSNAPRRFTVARTTPNSAGSLGSRISSRTPSSIFRGISWPSAPGMGGEVLDALHEPPFLQIHRLSQICSDEANVHGDVPFQDWRAVRSGELAMNGYGGGAGDRCHLPLCFASPLEAADDAVQNNAIVDSRGVAVPRPVHSRKSLFFQLMNQVFIPAPPGTRQARESRPIQSSRLRSRPP